MRVSQAMTVTCTRCGATVSTEYKYCPECAFRLRAGFEDGAEAQQPQPVWPHVALLLGAILLIGGFVLAGFALFGAPDVDVPEAPSRGLFTIHDLAERLVLIEAGVADWQPDVNPETGEPLVNPATGEIILLPVYLSAMRVSKHETSRGQWREFLEDIEARVADDPEALLDYAARELFDPLAPPRNVAGEPTDPFQGSGDAMGSVDAALAEMNAELDRVAWSEGYADLWWRATEDHLRERGIEATRPHGLSVPFDPELRHLFLVPPHWIRDADLSWELEPGTENLPVTEIAFPDAVAFALWATDQLGITFYVPTRAEFMRAYHGGDIWDRAKDTGNRYPWGPDERTDWANTLSLWGDATPTLLTVEHLLGPRVPGVRNALSKHGIYHLAGNAREWTQDQELIRTPAREPTEDGLLFYYSVQARQFALAPTLGGSYLLGLGEADIDAVLYVDLRDREMDIGFRLVSPATKPY